MDGLRVPMLLRAAFLVSMCVARAKKADKCMHLIVGPEVEQQAQHVLLFTLRELESVHPEIQLHRNSSTFDPATAYVGTDATIQLDILPPGTSHEERYTVTRDTTGRTYLHILAGGKLAVAYALHDLREHLSLTMARTGTASASSQTAREGSRCAAYVAALQDFSAPAPPVYELRTWSEEGQLLDLPERGYYCTASYSTTGEHGTQEECQGGINATLITAEMQALEYEIVPALLRLRMNSLTILHSDVEDYVTYASLPNFLPGTTPTTVYPAGDPHYARAAALAAIVGPWVQHLTTDYGLAVYFQPYEFSSAPNMCQGVNYPNGTFNCTLGSPVLLPLIQTRYTEFFKAVPAAAGIIATVADSFAPRASYDFRTLWTSTDELAQVPPSFTMAL